MSVFERFTGSARSVVVDAQRVAFEGRAREIRNDHLMVAVLHGQGGVGVRVLTAAGLGENDRAALLDELAVLNRRAGIGGGDAEALRDIGIDVDEVLGRMGELLAEPDSQPASRRSLPGRARAGAGRLLGRRGGGPSVVRFSTDAKHTLERTLREALDLRDRHIDEAHILLALVSRPGVVAETLQRYGVTYAGVRRAVSARADTG
ncbi:MAG: Clp protease N-terminal domain-containing protein [Streptosporangiales bacterium]